MRGLVIWTICVATLTLGLRPRQGLTKVRAKSEARESHFMLPTGWEYGRVGELNLHIPKWTLPLWEVEFRWIFESSKENCKDQNPSDWGVPYIIGKLLEHRCLNWARMTHLEIWNTSYGQNKGGESNCQIWLLTTKS